MTTQARADIHRDFRARETRRKAAYEAWLADHAGRASRWEVEEMAFNLQRAISDDWKAAVERYPEVLDYYYEQVSWEPRSSGHGRRSGRSFGSGSRTRQREIWRN